jgi:hypothetical protein
MHAPPESGAPDELIIALEKRFLKSGIGDKDFRAIFVFETKNVLDSFNTSC